MPQSLEEVSPSASAKIHRLALDRADEAMERAVPTDQSKTWEVAVGRVKRVMDMLGPVAEVRVIPFGVLS